ncbi:MAG TPA: hypothetical protein VML55_03860 [Planctomycetaceae bacterium]|nr:hypothetical protein [Planctomycetaceae bacterium]
MSFVSSRLLPLLAAAESAGGETTRTLQWDWPRTFEGWFAMVVVGAVLAGWVVWLYLRDTAELPTVATVWLLVLRLGVLAAIALVALNPHYRTQKQLFHPSRVGLLVDTSLSMDFPETVATTGSVPGSGRTRAQAVIDLLERSPLVEKLREQHQVAVFTFDHALEGPHHVFPAKNDPHAPGAASSHDPDRNEPDDDERGEPAAPPPEKRLDWSELLKPRGLDSRLGGAMMDLLRQFSDDTVAGIIVVSDGSNNAGIDPRAANAEARERGVRLITVGVGSTERQPNLEVAQINAPTHVVVGDAYEIRAHVRGQGLAGQAAIVELKRKPDGASDDIKPILAEVSDFPDPQTPPETGWRKVILPDDGSFVEVIFKQNPTEPAKIRYFVEARLERAVPESRDQDNLRETTITIDDRQTRVLIVAGGPMRDYQFVRNMLFRHAGTLVDVWLQTVDDPSRVSQESDELLTAFPSTAADLEKYDVLLLFDPDWQRIRSEQPETIKLLRDWVFDRKGGVVFVAGDVFTPELAAAEDELQDVLAMYPVSLSSYFLDVQFEKEDATQPWPLELTPEGSAAGFLQVADDATASRELWNGDFEGIYRVYPTAGKKTGATVYAYHSDVQAATEYGKPVLLASQDYGEGHAFYLGSGEMWRLRSLSDEYYDRFWTKLIREAGQGRRTQGDSPVTLLPEKTEVNLGETVKVTAVVLDSNYQPASFESVDLEVYDPRGRLLVPNRKLLPVKVGRGEYVGDFRAIEPGKYELRLPLPGSDKSVTKTVTVEFPGMEYVNTEQNASLLTELARDTGGKYVPLDEAQDTILSANMLPTRAREITIDQAIQTVWDELWVLYVLVGLLSLEWLTRKLVKLA